MKKKTTYIKITLLFVLIFTSAQFLFKSIIANPTSDLPFEIQDGSIGSVSLLTPNEEYTEIIKLDATTSLENAFFNYTRSFPQSGNLYIDCYIKFVDNLEKSLRFYLDNGYDWEIIFEPNQNRWRFKDPWNAYTYVQGTYQDFYKYQYHHLKIIITQQTNDRKHEGVYWDGKKIADFLVYRSEELFNHIKAWIRGNAELYLANLYITDVYIPFEVDENSIGYEKSITPEWPFQKTFMLETTNLNEVIPFNYIGLLPQISNTYIDFYIKFNTTHNKAIKLFLGDGKWLSLDLQHLSYSDHFVLSHSDLQGKYLIQKEKGSLALDKYHHIQIMVEQINSTEKSWKIYWDDELLKSIILTSQAPVTEIKLMIWPSDKWYISDYKCSSNIINPFKINDGYIGSSTYAVSESPFTETIELDATTSTDNALFKYTEDIPYSPGYYIDCYIKFTDTNHKAIKLYFWGQKFIYIKLCHLYSRSQFYMRDSDSSIAFSAYREKSAFELNKFHHLQIIIEQKTSTEKYWSIYWNQELIGTYTLIAQIKNHMTDIKPLIWGAEKWYITDFIIAPLMGSDLDNDGLTTDEEINQYGTNPVNPDTDGDGWSDKKEIDHSYNPCSPSADNKYALLVAASSWVYYNGIDWPYSGFSDMTNKWYELFRYEYGYPDDQIIYLVDSYDSSPGKDMEATLSNWESACEELRDLVSSDDQVTVIWTGHGSNGWPYLDLDISFELGHENYYDDNYFETYFDYIDCGKMFFFIATCFSEGFINNLDHKNNRIVYTACKRNEATDKEFFDFLTSKLKDDGFLSIGELMSWGNGYDYINGYHPQTYVGTSLNKYNCYF